MAANAKPKKGTDSLVFPLSFDTKFENILMILSIKGLKRKFYIYSEMHYKGKIKRLISNYINKIDTHLS